MDRSKSQQVYPSVSDVESIEGLTPRGSSFKRSPSHYALSRQQSINEDKRNKLNKLADRLEGSDEADPVTFLDVVEVYRVKTKAFITNNLIGRIYTSTLIFISAVSCLQYIYETYVEYNQGPTFDLINRICSIMELIFACTFLCDWILSFFLAEDRGLFLIR